jgi:8-oxo-dGTP diphosphatase
MENLVTTHIAAGVVVKKSGKYLLVQENHPNPDIYGKWNLPSGRVEEGQTIEETAIREVKEETGYDIELLRKLGIFHEIAKKPIVHIFEGKIIAGELKYPKDEILAAGWFTSEEIGKMKDLLREPFILKTIKNCSS